jgi:HK97 family phage major capsid protein
VSKLQEYQRELNQIHDNVAAFWRDADTKYPDLADMPSEERDSVKAMNRKIEELESRIVDSKAMQDQRDAAIARAAASRELGGGMVHPNGGDRPATPVAPKSLGEQFLNSPEWQQYYNNLAPVGQISEKQRVQSPKLLVPSGFKGLITGDSSTSGGAFVTPDRTGIFEPLGRMPLRLRDIITVYTTGSDLIEFVRQTTRTNNAAIVAEATASAGSSGVKPESDMALEVVTTTVKTVANWMAVTRQALADAPRMRQMIDAELRDNLLEVVEDQILGTGNGTGLTLEGLDGVSGTQDQAWSNDILETTRKARTLVRTVGRDTPTAYVMNPADWETIDLLQDNEARYFFGGPSQLGTPRLWGLPVVETEAQDAGNGWVGNFRKYALFDRQQSMISVTDSHSDFFIRNLIAVLAELRVAGAVIKPVAFVEIDLAA